MSLKHPVRIAIAAIALSGSLCHADPITPETFPEGEAFLIRAVDERGDPEIAVLRFHPDGKADLVRPYWSSHVGQGILVRRDKEFAVTLHNERLVEKRKDEKAETRFSREIAYFLKKGWQLDEGEIDLEKTERARLSMDEDILTGKIEGEAISGHWTIHPSARDDDPKFPFEGERVDYGKTFFPFEANMRILVVRCEVEVSGGRATEESLEKFPANRERELESVWPPEVWAFNVLAPHEFAGKVLQYHKDSWNHPTPTLGGTYLLPLHDLELKKGGGCDYPLNRMIELTRDFNGHPRFPLDEEFRKEIDTLAAELPVAP